MWLYVVVCGCMLLYVVVVMVVVVVVLLHLPWKTEKSSTSNPRNPGHPRPGWIHMYIPILLQRVSPKKRLSSHSPPPAANGHGAYGALLRIFRGCGANLRPLATQGSEQRQEPPGRLEFSNSCCVFNGDFMVISWWFNVDLYNGDEWRFNGDSWWFMVIYPRANQHSYKQSPFGTGKSAFNERFSIAMLD